MLFVNSKEQNKKARVETLSFFYIVSKQELITNEEQQINSKLYTLN